MVKIGVYVKSTGKKEGRKTKDHFSVKITWRGGDKIRLTHRFPANSLNDKVKDGALSRVSLLGEKPKVDPQGNIILELVSMLLLKSQQIFFLCLWSLAAKPWASYKCSCANIFFMQAILYPHKPQINCAGRTMLAATIATFGNSLWVQF